MELLLQLFGVILIVTGPLPRQGNAGATEVSWLEAPVEWNSPSPQLPEWDGSGPDPMCDATTRGPETSGERVVFAEGWKLRLPASIRVLVRNVIEVVEAFGEFDGMCRPIQAQAFVFMNDRFVGTLSPRRMNSRTDGSLVDVAVLDSGRIVARFARYDSGDPLCCPSRESTAGFEIVMEAGVPVLRLLNVDTRATVRP